MPQRWPSEGFFVTIANSPRRCGCFRVRQPARSPARSLSVPPQPSGHSQLGHGEAARWGPGVNRVPGPLTQLGSGRPWAAAGGQVRGRLGAQETRWVRGKETLPGSDGAGRGQVTRGHHSIPPAKEEGGCYRAGGRGPGSDRPSEREKARSALPRVSSWSFILSPQNAPSQAFSRLNSIVLRTRFQIMKTRTRETWLCSLYRSWTRLSVDVAGAIAQGQCGRSGASRSTVTVCCPSRYGPPIPPPRTI